MPPGEQGSVRGNRLTSGEPMIREGELKRARSWNVTLKFMLEELERIRMPAVDGTDNQMAAQTTLL